MLVCIGFGETLDPTHEWDAWTIDSYRRWWNIGSGNTDMKLLHNWQTLGKMWTLQHGNSTSVRTLNSTMVLR